MDTDDAPLGTPGRLQLNFPGTSKGSKAALNFNKPRRQSGEAKPTSNLQFSSLVSKMTGQGQTSGYEEYEREVAKSFNFRPAPNHQASHISAQNKAQQRESPHVFLNADTPSNALAPSKVQAGPIRARRSQQFVPPNASKPHASIVQKEVSRAFDVPQHPHQEDVSHSASTRREIQYGHPTKLVPRERLRIELQSQVLVKQVPNEPQTPSLFAANAHHHSHQTPQMELLSEPAIENEAYLYDEPQANSDREGDYGEYYANEHSEQYYDGSAVAEDQNFNGTEGYSERGQDDVEPTEPMQSQDAPAGPNPVPAPATGFLEHFEAYARSHQQEVHDAETKWKNATIEEWKAGKNGERRRLIIHTNADGRTQEMMERLRKIMDITKNHMKRKLDAYNAIHDDLDAQKEGLHKRRHVLGALEREATKSGSSLMNQLIGT